MRVSQKKPSKLPILVRRNVSQYRNGEMHTRSRIAYEKFPRSTYMELKKNADIAAHIEEEVACPASLIDTTLRRTQDVRVHSPAPTRLMYALLAELDKKAEQAAETSEIWAEYLAKEEERELANIAKKVAK